MKKHLEKELALYKNIVSLHCLLKYTLQISPPPCPPFLSSINPFGWINTVCQGAIIRVPTYRRYAKCMVWYFFVFRQVPRRYAEICHSRTYIFLLAITGKPAKVFKTVKNFSCTCTNYTHPTYFDIFWDALDQNIYSHRPTEKKSLG